MVDIFIKFLIIIVICCVDFLFNFFLKYGNVWFINCSILCVWIVFICFFCFNVEMIIDIKIVVLMLLIIIIGSVINDMRLIVYVLLWENVKMFNIWIIFIIILIMVFFVIFG